MYNLFIKKRVPAEQEMRGKGRDIVVEQNVSNNTSTKNMPVWRIKPGERDGGANKLSFNIHQY